MTVRLPPAPGRGGASAGDRPAGLPLSEAGPVCPLLTEALALGAVRAGAPGDEVRGCSGADGGSGDGPAVPPERCHRGRREADARKPGPRSRVQAGFKGRGARVGVRAEGLGPGARSWLCPALGSGGSRGPTFPSGPLVRVARGFGPVPLTSHSAPRRTGRGVLSARGGFAGPPEAAAPVTVRKGQREAPSAKGSCAPRLLCHVAPLTCTASGSRRGPLARQVSASNVGRRCSRRACRGCDRWIERPPHVVEKVKSDVTPAGA